MVKTQWLYYWRVRRVLKPCLSVALTQISVDCKGPNERPPFTPHLSTTTHTSNFANHHTNANHPSTSYHRPSRCRCDHYYLPAMQATNVHRSASPGQNLTKTAFTYLTEISSYEGERTPRNSRNYQSATIRWSIYRISRSCFLAGITGTSLGLEVNAKDQTKAMRSTPHPPPTHTSKYLNITKCRDVKHTVPLIGRHSYTHHRCCKRAGQRCSLPQKNLLRSLNQHLQPIFASSAPCSIAITI